MSKSDGVPKNDLNPGSANRGAGTGDLNPGSSNPGPVVKPRRGRVHSRKHGGTGVLNPCFSGQVPEDLPGPIGPSEMTLLGPSPEALKALGSDDATCSTQDLSEAPQGCPGYDRAAGEVFCSKCNIYWDLDIREDCPGCGEEHWQKEHWRTCVHCSLQADVDILKESVSRVLAQRDELQRRLTAVQRADAEALIPDALQPVLLAALCSRARELGRRAGVYLRTEMSESAVYELERARGDMRDLMGIAQRLLPGAAYLVSSDFDSESLSTQDELEFGVGGVKPLPPPPAKDEIPW